MSYLQSPGHSTSIEVNASCDTAFNYLKEPMNLGNWALGSWNSTKESGENLYSGISLFSNEKVYFKIESDEKRYLVDFLVGSPDLLQPRISARVIPGPYYGSTDSFSLITLNAWRDLSMSDERWHQLCMCHETEILLIKSLIENI